MKVLFQNKDELMNLSTKKSFLSLLIATAFLTGCQKEQNSASDNQVSTTAAPILAPKNSVLPYGRSKKIVEDPIVVDPIVTEPRPVVATCVAGNANIEGLVTDKAIGVGLPNVQINIGACTTTTDTQGFYKLANIASSDKAVVNFDAEGYVRNSAVVQTDQYLEGTITGSQLTFRQMRRGTLR